MEFGAELLCANGPVSNEMKPADTELFLFKNEYLLSLVVN